LKFIVINTCVKLTGLSIPVKRYSRQEIMFKHLDVKIILINGARLSELMIDYNVGVQQDRFMK
jgi:restriction endonuclease Mrr